MNLRKFFAELKRRNVYKVAIAYAVVAWLLMQIATQVFPFLEIPNWAIRLVIMLIVIGFPIALVIAWAFELTPEGLKRTGVCGRIAKKIGAKSCVDLCCRRSRRDLGEFVFLRALHCDKQAERVG
jgi:hypothetical protein